MKHKFHGQQCVYCGANAETSDHTIGRKFFLEEQRANLPQVPACVRCNNRKSHLEAYLMIVLPFGAKNPDARKILEKLVPPRLEKNAKLYRNIQRGFLKSGGQSIPFEHNQLTELFAMVAQALLWQHWRVRLGEGHGAIGSIFSDQAERFFRQMLVSAPRRVTGNLGEGTFSYEGSQMGHYPELSLWKFQFYGGVDFGGDSRVSRASLAMALTGRSDLIQRLRYSEFKHDKTAVEPGRNDPCPCDSGKKYKKCHGNPANSEPCSANVRQLLS
jgi:hypothetical protein